MKLGVFAWMARAALRCLTITGCLLCLRSGALADQLTILPSLDTTIFSESAKSNARGPYLFSGITRTGNKRRALIAFDIAKALPKGTVITGVTLQLHASRALAASAQMDLHRLQEAWGEGSSLVPELDGRGTAATAGDATWLDAEHEQRAWKTPGGDFDAEPQATTVVGEVGSYTFSSPAMVRDAQDWLDAPSRNFGWILIAEQSQGTAKGFESREYPGSTRPSLTITYQAPAQPVGACCDLHGQCDIRFDAASCTGTFSGLNTGCEPNPCPQPVGACCIRGRNNSCAEQTLLACADSGGVWQGPLVSCQPSPCQPLLTPFVDPLPVPPLAKPEKSENGVEHYRISMIQKTQKLHRDLPETTVWAYSDGHYAGTPGPTIQAQVDQTVRVTWANELRDEQGNLRTTHILPVDHCVHGAHDDAPRTVVHLHGAHVPAEYDGQPESTLLPGQEALYEYPNHQVAATLWYHDHAIGITRLNVYMGLAGFYLLRDPQEDALALPSGEYEIPLLIQDRDIASDGHLLYPAKWEDHFFGEVALINGKAFPYFEVKRGMYRFRLLNGSGSRSYTLSLSGMKPMIVIGNDGGLLPKPVQLRSVTLSPSERLEVVIDFSEFAPGDNVYLYNAARTPFPEGGRSHPLPRLMQFRVGEEPGYSTPLPATLRPRRELPEDSAVVTRDFVLGNVPDECSDSVWLINGKMFDEITERPVLGTREIWRFINPMRMTHPMHMHLVTFQVLDRQKIEGDLEHTVPVGERQSPRPEEGGGKDTVQVGPMEMVRVIAEFTDYAGRYAYHCHILEHEDQAMMRQFETVDPNAPADAGSDVPHDIDGGHGSALDAGHAGHDRQDAAPTEERQPEGGCACSTSAPEERLGWGWLWCCAAGLYLCRRPRRTASSALIVALVAAPCLTACDDPERAATEAGDSAPMGQVAASDASASGTDASTLDDAGSAGSPDGGLDGSVAAETDSDSDGAADDFERACGTDPRDPRSAPSAELLIGQGTVASPFLLCLPQHLDLLALHPSVASAHAELRWDLDFAGRAPPPSLGTALSPFAGVLSGRGHRLTNLDFDLLATPRAGLVEVVGAGGLIEDLTIEAKSSAPGTLGVGTNAGTLRRVTVIGDAAGVDHVGMLAKVNAASGVIEDCHAQGSVSATKSHAGGLVGENLGSVRDSSSSAQVRGENRTGGLVGTNGGSVQRSFATGSVAGTKDFIGGLIGTLRSGGSVQDAYARGDVSAGGFAGGLVGSVQKSGAIERCYARNNVSSPKAQGFLGVDEDQSASVASSYFDGSANASDAFATALDASQVLLRASYVAFDFADGTGVWTMVDGQDSPTLVRR